MKLHYLDWAGTGETLLFLAGGRHSARIYDDLAPEFAGRFRVEEMRRFLIADENPDRAPRKKRK